jgi:hypothetical protein
MPPTAMPTVPALPTPAGRMSRRAALWLHASILASYLAA